MESRQVDSRTNHSQAIPKGGGPEARFHPSRRVFPLCGDFAGLDLAEALSRLRARRDPVLLDSAGGAPRAFSLLAFDPLPTQTPRTLVELRALLASYQPDGEGDDLPVGARVFGGGFVGALSYDLGAEGEDLGLPIDPWGLPTIAGGLYCDYILRDEQAGQNWLVLGHEPGDDRPSVALRKSAIESALATPMERHTLRPLAPMARRVSPALHRARVQAVRELIAAGEIYQANLAHPFRGELEGDPVDLYLALRAASPTPYAGFLRADDEDGNALFAILSCSPELLLEVIPGGEAQAAVARTRPIKGTVERPMDVIANREQDLRAAAELMDSAKDRAELAMIVDLERNDLGKLALPGGVSVSEFPQLESHRAVHHLVADVRASLPEDVSALDVLGALFPGGSITGAPKLRSMEVIAELEEEGRGFAFGSLGCVDRAGSAHFNILIRTMVWRPLAGAEASATPKGELLLRVGGGITWGSDPAAEDRETLAKAAALLAALP